MSWTKREILDQAFAEIGLASYVFDLEAEDVQVAVARLDGLMAALQIDGIRLGYPLAASPKDTDPDQDSNIPLDCNVGIYQLLAIMLAPTVGKTVSQATAAGATKFLNKMLVKFSKPIPMQFGRSLPRGAGNKPWRGVGSVYFLERYGIAVDQDGVLSS